MGGFVNMGRLATKKPVNVHRLGSKEKTSISVVPFL